MRVNITVGVRVRVRFEIGVRGRVRVCVKLTCSLGSAKALVRDG